VDEGELVVNAVVFLLLGLVKLEEHFVKLD